MNLLFFLAAAMTLAVAAAAYQLGSTTEPSCTQCAHCQQRQRDRERRLDEAQQREDQLLRAFRALPEPPVREAAPPAAESETRQQALSRFLVAYDGGQAARRALARAAQLAKGLGASISVLSVVPVEPGRLPFSPWDDQSVHAQQLEEAESYLATAGVKAQLLGRVGRPAEVIARTADEGAYDAVLLGSDRVGGLARAVFGSIPAYVTAHTRSTVIIVH
jgi:nucleotide-binding universal stress UspA family protein